MATPYRIPECKCDDEHEFEFEFDEFEDDDDDERSEQSLRHVRRPPVTRCPGGSSIL